MIESNLVYRKGASPSGVPDAITLKDSIILLKNAVYERVSGASGNSLATKRYKVCETNLHKNYRKGASPSGVNEVAAPTQRQGICLTP